MVKSLLLLLILLFNNLAYPCLDDLDDLISNEDDLTRVLEMSRGLFERGISLSVDNGHLNLKGLEQRPELELLALDVLEKFHNLKDQNKEMLSLELKNWIKEVQEENEINQTIYDQILEGIFGLKFLASVKSSTVSLNARIVTLSRSLSYYVETGLNPQGSVFDLYRYRPRYGMSYVDRIALPKIPKIEEVSYTRDKVQSNLSRPIQAPNDTAYLIGSVSVNDQNNNNRSITHIVTFKKPRNRTVYSIPGFSTVDEKFSIISKSQPVVDQDGSLLFLARSDSDPDKTISIIRFNGNQHAVIGKIKLDELTTNNSIDEVRFYSTLRINQSNQAELYITVTPYNKHKHDSKVYLYEINSTILKKPRVIHQYNKNHLRLFFEGAENREPLIIDTHGSRIIYSEGYFFQITNTGRKVITDTKYPINILARIADNQFVTKINNQHYIITIRDGKIKYQKLKIDQNPKKLFLVLGYIESTSTIYFYQKVDRKKLKIVKFKISEDGDIQEREEIAELVNHSMSRQTPLIYQQAGQILLVMEDNVFPTSIHTYQLNSGSVVE